ncbi:hypothetical protein [Salinimonas iocasae]|uniref:Haem-binding uptake Tiki superfamily ChaN domain-containing protein n=1 Tax=Salinimonas iocasae TaxID=2572577 RepID=A0A5B7YF03_9ALTE|nr:hypothetical protein [Salinimonas iocasae]QCZ94221.1 hypothetical protein FBQ74_12410 [Salinimonas iocasae]
MRNNVRSNILRLLAAIGGALFSVLPLHADDRAPELEYVPVDRIAKYSPLFIGETHGTREVAGFVTDLISHSVKTSPVDLMLELPADMNELIQHYFSDTITSKELLGHSFWTRNIQDGRSSVAVFNLIKRVKALRGERKAVDIIAFDTRRDGKKKLGDRETIMAQNISAHIEKANEHVIIIVTGRVHANKALLLDNNRQAVATQLTESQRFTSVNMVATSGDYWACFSHPEKIFDCGRKVIGARQMTGFDQAMPEGIYINMKSDKHFDGILFFRHVESSPPAINR